MVKGSIGEVHLWLKGLKRGGGVLSGLKGNWSTNLETKEKILQGRDQIIRFKKRVNVYGKTWGK